MKFLKCIGQRIPHPEFTVMQHPGQHQADHDIGDSGDHQRHDDGPGQIPAGVPAFFGCGGNSIKSNVGKKHPRNSFQHPGHPVWSKRMPVFRVDIKGTNGDDKQQNADFQ